MKEEFILFVVAFIVISSVFASYTGYALIKGGNAESGDIPDNETTATDIFSGITNLSSDEWYLSPILLIIAVFMIVIIFIYVYPFAT